jgi:uncharacterized protein with PQ loop repeat
MKTEIIIIIGVATAVLSILVKVIGFPDQMRKNYIRKSTEGISTYFFVISFITYVLWTIHGILVKDWVVYLGQGLGIITTGIILYQIYLYRKNKNQN